MARAEDTEDHHGSIFSVSGPVVVAEDMIGCAMYELVSCDRCFGLPRWRFLLTYTVFSSAELDMTSSLVRLLGSREIRPPSRSTKRQV